MHTLNEKIKKNIIKALKTINVANNHFSKLPQKFKDYNNTRIKLFPKTFCYAASTNLYFGFDGKVTACCFNRTHLLGQYPQQNIREIWDGKERKSLIKKLSNYDVNSGCRSCETCIDEHTPEAVHAKGYDRLNINPRFPSEMEFEIDNTCNLQCIMCEDTFSSQITKFSGERNKNKNVYDQNFIEQLKEYIPHLKRAKFLGGEPFLINLYYEIWETIIAINPSCEIFIQTNGTVLNDKIKSLLNCGKFNFCISLDSLKKEPYEHIRLNANFKHVMENFNYFLQYTQKKKTFFSIAVCPMQQNWKEIPEMINFYNQHQKSIFFNRVWKPKKCTLTTLKSDELLKIKQYYFSFTFPQKTKTEYNNNLQFCGLRNQVETWYHEALKTEENLKKYTSVPITFLEDKIISDIINYCKSQSADYTRQIDTINNIFSKFRNEKNYLLLISKILEYPIKTLNYELANRTEQNILKLASKIIFDK